MDPFRYLDNPLLGQKILLGASWNWLPWFVGAGVLFIVAHALYKLVVPSGGSKVPNSVQQGR